MLYLYVRLGMYLLLYTYNLCMYSVVSLPHFALCLYSQLQGEILDPHPQHDLAQKAAGYFLSKRFKSKEDEVNNRLFFFFTPVPGPRYYMCICKFEEKGGALSTLSYYSNVLWFPLPPQAHFALKEGKKKVEKAFQALEKVKCVIFRSRGFSWKQKLFDILRSNLSLTTYHLCFWQYIFSLQGTDIISANSKGLYLSHKHIQKIHTVQGIHTVQVHMYVCM